MICSNYPKSTLSNKKSITVFGDRIYRKRGSHNRRSAIGKARTEIENSKAHRTDDQFVDDRGKH